MKTFMARVKLGPRWDDVQIQANNLDAARRLLENQYGRGNISALREVR